MLGLDGPNMAGDLSNAVPSPLQTESERLARSWLRHDADMLRDYLVAGVEDPRINVQSVLSRQFLTRELTGGRFGALMEQECRFAAVMNWLMQIAGEVGDEADSAAVLRALRLGADNVEGAEIPRFVRDAFAFLPAIVEGLSIPNYIERFLRGLEFHDSAASERERTGNKVEAVFPGTLASPFNAPNISALAHSAARLPGHGAPIARIPQGPVDTFRDLWRLALRCVPIEEPNCPDEATCQDMRDVGAGASPSPEGDSAPPALSQSPHREWVRPAQAGSRKRLTVLEPGCGSANDYRFLDAYGIAQHLDYVGLDICRKNIENARGLFPNICFREGNLFQIAAEANSYDLCFLHDVLEHLSIEGLHAAVSELCRVTRLGLCIGCFNVDEILEHVVVPFEEYHWNTLSLQRLRELFWQHGFDSRAIHIRTFLREQIGCAHTHNPSAYTFILWRVD